MEGESFAVVVAAVPSILPRHGSSSTSYSRQQTSGIINVVRCCLSYPDDLMMMEEEEDGKERL
jgi:hypothetical protein